MGAPLHQQLEGIHGMDGSRFDSDLRMRIMTKPTGRKMRESLELRVLSQGVCYTLVQWHGHDGGRIGTMTSAGARTGRVKRGLIGRRFRKRNSIQDSTASCT